ENPDLVRIVEGVSGTVEMTTEICIRFDYGRIVPWVRRRDGLLHAIGGPDSVWIHSPVPLEGGGYRHSAAFRVSAGDRLPFIFTWHPSYQPPPEAIDPIAQLAATRELWEEWVSRCTYHGPWRDAVVRSLITLKALTSRPTGGIVAAAPVPLLARAARRGAELGLPVLLAAGRRDAPRGAHQHRVPGGGGRLARLADPGRGRPPRGSPGRVRRGGRTAAARADPRLA